MSRRQEKKMGYVTISYQQPMCDLCKADVPVGEHKDDRWTGSMPVYRITFMKEHNGIQGNATSIEVCSECWNKHFVTLMRKIGLDTGGVI